MAADGTGLCPHCGSEIKAVATISRYCRKDVEPLAAPRDVKPPKPARSEAARKRTPAALLLSVVASRGQGLITEVSMRRGGAGESLI